MTEKEPPDKPDKEFGDVNITIGGNVGPGAVIGPNSSVRANNIAGRDLTDLSTHNHPVETSTKEDFSKMLSDLRQMIVEARDKGELDEEATQKALDNVQAATDLAGQKEPPKKNLLKKLEDLSDLLDGAAQTIEAAGGVAHTVLKAMPIVALLLKLASYLF